MADTVIGICFISILGILFLRAAAAARARYEAARPGDGDAGATVRDPTSASGNVTSE